MRGSPPVRRIFSTPSFTKRRARVRTSEVDSSWPRGVSFTPSSGMQYWPEGEGGGETATRYWWHTVTFCSAVSVCLLGKALKRLLNVMSAAGKRPTEAADTFNMTQWEQILTAQVAFLSQGDAQVAVPPTELVRQESRKGDVVFSQPLLQKTETTGKRIWNDAKCRQLITREHSQSRVLFCNTGT